MSQRHFPGADFFVAGIFFGRWLFIVFMFGPFGGRSGGPKSEKPFHANIYFHPQILQKDVIAIKKKTNCHLAIIFRVNQMANVAHSQYNVA